MDHSGIARIAKKNREGQDKMKRTLPLIMGITEKKKGAARQIKIIR